MPLVGSGHIIINLLNIYIYNILTFELKNIISKINFIFKNIDFFFLNLIIYLFI